MTAALIDVGEQPRTGAHDLSSLGKMLFQLVGEPFLFARFSYGEELTLHFGILGEAKHPALRAKGINYGSYVLRSRGSGWVLKSGSRGNIAFDGVPHHLNPAILASELKPISEQEIERGGFLTPGTLVYRTYTCTVEQVDGIGFRIDMSDGASVFVVPTPDEPLPPDSPELPELADWELETPHGTLRVGPGRKWDWEPKQK